jgi:hypothetical protein
MDKCMYSASGHIICSEKPFYIDRTGMMKTKPAGTVFWDSVPMPKMDPACLNIDMPCCPKEGPKRPDCKPAACCVGMGALAPSASAPGRKA